MRSSQRTTLAHWLILSGRSRCPWIHLPNMCQIIVSDVGRTISGSSSSAPGSGSTPLLPSASVVERSRWCVTTAHSLAKPSTCSASFERKETGMKGGKYAFRQPVALIRASRSSRTASHSAIPFGLITMHPLTGLPSTRSPAAITSLYHAE